MFGGSIEWSDLGDCIDECIVIKLRNRLPIDGIAERIGVAFRFLFERSAFGDGEHVSLLILLPQLGIKLAERRADIQFARDGEALEPFKHNIIPPVFECLDVANPTKAAPLTR